MYEFDFAVWASTSGKLNPKWSKDLRDWEKAGNKIPIDPVKFVGKSKVFFPGGARGQTVSVPSAFGRQLVVLKWPIGKNVWLVETWRPEQETRQHTRAA